MTDGMLTKRRRLLQTAGASGLVALAGCTGFGSDNGNGDDATGEEETDDDEETGDEEESTGEDGDDTDEPTGEQREVAVITRLSPEANQELQAIQMQVQTGEIDEEEAEEEMERILSESLEDLRTRIDTDSSATVEEEITMSGAVRLSGTADDLLDVLEFDESEAIVSTGDIETP